MDPAPTIQIRPASTLDAEQIARINIDVWRSTYEGIIDRAVLDTMALGDYIAKWQRILTPEIPERRWCFVATLGTDVIGYVSAGTNDDNDGYGAVLYALYLRPEYHGLGVGKLLWQTMMHAFEERGVSSFKLYVLTANKLGRRFYDRYRPDVCQEADFHLDGAVYCDMLYGWNDVSHALAE
ncbi:MAG: GNAT family N-acetyltransferase [Bacteroidetes bacterium]|nr:GNAT family N-acetyltransferase [Bacteroidota bacterium]